MILRVTDQIDAGGEGFPISPASGGLSAAPLHALYINP